jgi:hypothetical protein
MAHTTKPKLLPTCPQPSKQHNQRPRQVFGLVPLVLQQLMQGDHHHYSLYFCNSSLDTECSYTANQTLGARNTELGVHEEALRYKGFLYARGRKWMSINGGLLLNAHSNYSSISDPSVLNNTVGFCIDAGDLEQLVFLTRVEPLPVFLPS